MILRKPYAFLIKHFRLIHIIMTLCVGFVLYKTWSIYSFFSDYISNGQKIAVTENVTSYVSDFLFVFVFILIIANSIILYLMNHKKKPIVIYAYSLIVYIALAIALFFSSDFIYELQFVAPDTRITSLVKDGYLGLFLLQIAPLILFFVRGIGFDVKKFDFRNDIMDFEISDEDSEEFEFELGLDTEDMKAKARRKWRFFKYYYKENKIVFYSIFVIIGVVLVVGISNFISSIEKVYKENEIFETPSFNIKVVDSFKTFYDYKGEKVKSGKFYVILKLNYYNKSSVAKGFTLDNAMLNLDEYTSITPTKLMYDKFSEYGVPYYSQFINPGENREFMIVYELDEKYYNNDLKLKYLYSAEYVNNQVEYLYRIVDIKETNVDKFSDKSSVTKKVGEELVFKDSLLGNTTFKVEDVSLANDFSYNVIICKNKECDKRTKFLQAKIDKTYQLTLMRLKYSLNFDKSVWGSYSIKNFIEKYGSIRFVIGEKEYEHKIRLKDVTPYENPNFIFLEVRDKLMVADSIYLDFTIRDKKYTYALREKEEVKEEIEDEKEEVTA